MTHLLSDALCSTFVPLMQVDEVNFVDDDPDCLRPSSETVTRWLAAVSKLHRAPASSPEFYADAAQFAVDVVGLDRAAVVTLSDGRWQLAGSYAANNLDASTYNEDYLDLLRQRPKTLYQSRPAADGATARLSAVVLAPIIDLEGQLVAAVYGVRDTSGDNRRRAIRPMEARLVQLLAESVAVGIARMTREAEAARDRVLLEHAFSPTVAHFIKQHPDSLAPRQREVTLLFADICEFTALAEVLTPSDCYHLLANIMEVLTEIVVAHQGVVVDYYGDGLLAMWNAPCECDCHAVRACRAALEMFDCMPSVNQRWRERLGRPLQLGVGVHTGTALVGNAGTHRRIKFGPRGAAVNVASRVLAAGKQLHLPLVVTKPTADLLCREFRSLRVCTAKLTGLEQNWDLYTVYPACELDAVGDQMDRYSEALVWFEAGNLVTAERLLAELADLDDFAPAHFLAHLTAERRLAAQGRRVSDKATLGRGPVIELTAK